MALSATVPSVQHMLGMVRLLQGQFGLAAELFARARVTLPQDPVLAYNEGQALAGLGRWRRCADSVSGPHLALKPRFHGGAVRNRAVVASDRRAG